MTERAWLIFVAVLILACDETPNAEQAPEIPNTDQMIQMDMGISDAILESDMAIMLPGPEANLDFRIGVESVTVLQATPGAHLTIVSPDGDDLLTVVADPLGQAHFAYIPETHTTTTSSGTTGIALVSASVLQAGYGYMIRDNSTAPASWTYPFRVLALEDTPDPQLYDDQTLDGTPVGLLPGIETDTEVGYQYIRMRDGVTLSAMIRFPDPRLYGDGPYPTVIEYSGYSPSRPNRADTPARIAGALGYATVSVNLRGSGCSGGVFDIFNRAQQADGYDVVEAVARQPWVLNHQVGMVGLSYPGITQLYVGASNPPSLAAIVPLSVIADAWEMQYPGGIYNAGFTRQWVDRRESDASAGGSTWVNRRIEEGDTMCAQNLSLSAYGFDFETVLKEMFIRPSFVDDRDLNQLVEVIKAPVFLGGAFHDEQTGAQFASFLDRFYETRRLKAVISNGRHPDGYAPQVVFKWFEFLEFYLAERIPVLNAAIRTVGAEEFGNSFGMETAAFEPDRFTAYDSYESALAAYEAEPSVALFFENGAGDAQPGSPVVRFETAYAEWPTDTATTMKWFAAADGGLALTPADEPTAHVWTFDELAGGTSFFGESGYQLSAPIWDTEWTRFAPGHILSYETAPFETAQVVAGPGIAELWVNSPVDEVTVQVTLTEIRPDGQETLIQSGWLKLGHRKAELGENLRLIRRYSEADFSPMPLNTWVPALVAMPSVAHPVRAGSRLRMLISAPGRDHGLWEFRAPEYETIPSFQLGLGGMHPTSLTMSILPDIDIPESYPPCPSLRGQPCRNYEAIENAVAP